VNILSGSLQVITSGKTVTNVGSNLLLSMAYYPSSAENRLEDKTSPKLVETNSIILNLFFANEPKKTKGEFKEPWLRSTFQHKTSRI
jgi:hypothetical protein